jgi:hypothetical protein
LYTNKLKPQFVNRRLSIVNNLCAGDSGTGGVRVAVIAPAVAAPYRLKPYGCCC